MKRRFLYIVLLLLSLTISVSFTGAQILQADGSFESFAAVAGDNTPNSNVNGNGWSTSVGGSDTWVSPVPDNPPVRTVEGMPSSPNGGIFATSGGFSSATKGEFIQTTVPVLVIGEKYKVSFYQANAGDQTYSTLTDRGRWEVQFGSDIVFSNSMTYLGAGSQVWEYQEFVFTATSISQDLTFTMDIDGALNIWDVEYMAIDGIDIEWIQSCDAYINANPACPGDPSSFSVNTTKNLTAWEWDFGDGNTSNSENSDHVFASGGPYKVTLEVTDILGVTCSTDTTIIINNRPNVNAGADLTVCKDANVNLAASGAAGMSYVWNNGITDNVAFIPPVSGEYIVTGTDGNGCTNTDSVMIDVVSVSVDAGIDVIFCLGDSVLLFGDGAGIGGLYGWNNSVIDGVPFFPNGTNNYKVTGTDINGCTGEDSLMVSLSTSPIPQASFTANPLTGCAPLDVDFLADDVTGSAYNWVFGDGAIGTEFSVPHRYVNPGSYDVSLTVTSIDGCVTTERYMDFVVVSGFPIADFSFKAEDSESDPAAINFTNKSVNGDRYEWDFGDGSAISNDPDPIYEFSELNKEFQVELKVTNLIGCEDSITKAVFINDILLYFVPNAIIPDNNGRNDSFKPVFVSGLDIQNYHLHIFDRWGQVVFESTDFNESWDGTYEGSIVQHGMYVWQINFGETMSENVYLINGTVAVIR